MNNTIQIHNITSHLDTVSTLTVTFRKQKSHYDNIFTEVKINIGETVIRPKKEYYELTNALREQLFMLAQVIKGIVY